MRTTAGLLLLALSLGCGPELAERFDGAELPSAIEPGLVERSHQVEVRLQEHQAHLWVTREYLNQGHQVEELFEQVRLPPNATVVAFRTGFEGVWTEARLFDADQADGLYRPALESQSPGVGHHPMGLLSWVEERVLLLQAFPLRAGQSLSVQYAVQVAMEYQGGDWHFSYPHPEPNSGATPQYSFAGPWDAADVRIEGPAVNGEEWEEAEPETTFRIHRAPIDVVAGRWAVRRVAEDKQLWQLELDVAEELGALPRNAHVVFVLDGSRSQEPHGLELQLQLVKGYLSHLPDAEVELVIYRRTAEPVFGQFVPAPEVGLRWAQLPAPKRALGNGSNLDEGARLAAQLLAAHAGPRRMLILSDDLWRPGFGPWSMHAALDGVGELIPHLVRLDADALNQEQRMDHHPLAAVMEAHGGIALNVIAELESADWKGLTLGLVRPFRLDSVSVEASDMELDVPVQLEEGEPVRLRALATTAPHQVTMRAKLWGREIVHPLPTDGALFDELAHRAVTDSNVRRQLSAGQAAELARSAAIVPPHTSFLAQPPLPGYPFGQPLHGMGVGLKGFSVGCFGTRGGTFGHGTGGGGHPDYPSFLRHQLEQARLDCRVPAGEPVEVAVHTTWHEIAAVQVTSAPAWTDCLTEHVWSWALPEWFRQDHADHAIRSQ